MDVEILLLIAYLLVLTKKKKRRRYWIHPINLTRLTDSDFYLMHPKLLKYPERFFDFYRMSTRSFYELLYLIKARLRKQDTLMRLAIPAEEKLAITLRYLATGRNFEELKHDYLMGSCTISQIVKDTCKVIWDALQPLEMKPPSSKEGWLEISENFYRRTNFPNCLGAVDGKHIRLICPQFSGSNFYNYKTYYSIVLLAVVDSDYRFLAIDVGSYGRESDSNIFNNWIFAKMLHQNQLNIPDPTELPNTEGFKVPHVFLGDEAFPLNTNFMRPYPRSALISNSQRRIFNYRLCRARRVVECAFGILSNKWRIFHTNMTISPDFAMLVTKTACILHNYVRARDGYNFKDTLVHYFDDNPYRYPRHRSTNEGRCVRDKFTEYFNSPAGEVQWQNQRIQNTT